MPEKLRGTPHRLLGHLAYLRYIQGKSLATVHNDTGIGTEIINTWELGRGATRIRNLEYYAAYYGLTVEFAQNGLVVPLQPSPWLPK